MVAEKEACFCNNIRRETLVQNVVFTGRRKSAIAQVKLVEGGNDVIINGKSAAVYMQENAFAITAMEAPVANSEIAKEMWYHYNR